MATIGFDGIGSRYDTSGVRLGDNAEFWQKRLAECRKGATIAKRSLRNLGVFVPPKEFVAGEEDQLMLPLTQEEPLSPDQLKLI